MSRSITSASGAHRLALSAAEYAYLVGRLELSMPPGWEPAPDTAPAAQEEPLAKCGVLSGAGDLLAVHPSVVVNLRILAGPQVMLETTAAIEGRGLHSLHAVAGRLGASLFALAEGGVELSMFAAVDLGRELIRAVPPEEHTAIASVLGGPVAQPLRGRVRVEALHELGIAALMHEADSQAPAAVLAELDLAAGEAELARQATSRTDGTLRCAMTGRMPDGVTTDQVAWLHTDAGWVGMRPDPDGSGRRMVRLEPAARQDLGTWVAPFVAAVLS